MASNSLRGSAGRLHADRDRAAPVDRAADYLRLREGKVCVITGTRGSVRHEAALAEEVTKVVLLPAFDDSSYVTGVDLIVRHVATTRVAIGYCQTKVGKVT